MSYDLFVSHASEDRAEFVKPLVGALEDRGLRVWWDSHEIELGDDFRRKMDEGLGSSRFGAVVVSPSFRKHWPEAELSALFTQERVFDEKRILPVIHALSPREVASSWPLLAARSAVYSSEGIEVVADKICSAIRRRDTGRTGGASRLYGVPRLRSVQFVGRAEELAQLEELLSCSGSVRLAASIEGLAGVGKTELALQLVHRLAERKAFPGGIFWFDAETPDLIPTWSTVIADTLGVPTGPGFERTAQAVRAVSRRQEPVLIVLDNVEQWTADHQPAPLPEGTHLCYLVTTRQRSLGGTRFQHLSVGFLENKFAQKLLNAVAGRDVTAAPGHDDLLDYLAGHALAIELAGAFLSEYPEETPASYLAALRSGLEVEEEVSDLVRYSRTVDQAFATIWERLEEEAHFAWRLAACFEPEFASPQLAAATGLSANNRRRLRRLHLIESNTEGRWRMHRLTRAFGSRSGPGQELAAAQEAFVRGCAEFSEQIDFAAGFRFYLPDRPHLDSALGQASEVLEPEELSRFQGRIGTALESAGALADARELLEQALASDLENLDEDHPAVAAHRSDLALVLQDLGELPAARDLLEQALASDLENLGEDHPAVAVRRSNLAGVLQDLGDLIAARELLEQALASDLENLGEDHPTVAAHRSALAGVLKDLGKLPAARDLLELALASDLDNLGEDHPSVADRRSSLAMVLQDLGELPAAGELLEQALASDLENLGEDHPHVAIRRSNLALVVQDLGDLRAARELLEQALMSDLENLGEDHPSVAARRSNLAGVLQDLGELPEARKLLQLALASDLVNLGEDHPAVAARRSNLALVLQDLGELAAARALLEQALASDLENLGEDHPSVATRRSNLALVLQDLGELPVARALLEQALASDLENFDEDHPSVAIRRSNLALVLQELGELPAARELLEQAFAWAFENLREGHPHVATSRSNLSLVLRDLGELPQARELLEQALASDLETLGEDHPLVAARRSNLALVLRDMGEFPAARELLKQALTSDLKNLSKDHPSLATSRFNLAGICESEGDLDAARDLFECALESEKLSLGENHPSLALTRVRLAAVLHTLGRTERAEAEAEVAMSVVARQPKSSSFRRKVEEIARSIILSPLPDPDRCKSA